ncbi:MAG: hypothetical protein FJ004_11705 [Chloroflexi bacterium]|nr:hypothetical protein [Chloroflexota bacterium]
MNKNEREAKRREQSEALYAAVGRFVVKFEQLCDQMTMCIISVLGLNGLRTQGLAWAILADFTADPLLQSFRAVIAELRKNNSNDMRILKNISKRIEKLIEERNDVLHRTWFIGAASEQQEDFSKVDSWKFKKTKTGAEYKPREGSVDKFNALSNEAEELANIIFQIIACMGFNTSFSRALKVEEDGTVRLPKKGNNGLPLRK